MTCDPFFEILTYPGMVPGFLDGEAPLERLENSAKAKDAETVRKIKAIKKSAQLRAANRRKIMKAARQKKTKAARERKQVFFSRKSS